MRSWDVHYGGICLHGIAHNRRTLLYSTNIKKPLTTALSLQPFPHSIVVPSATKWSVQHFQIALTRFVTH